MSRDTDEDAAPAGAGAARAVVATRAVAAARRGGGVIDDAPTQPAAPPDGADVPAVKLAGRYVLVRELGAGGMGTVYAGYDCVLDRAVAVKVLSPHAAGNAESRARMMREAQAMARVSSPHVLIVHDVGTDGDLVYIAMELMSGATLRTWLRDEPRRWREIVRVFEAAGRGLAAAHAGGLIHRDFKPDNVLIEGDKVRVADFGVAAAAARGEGAGAGAGPPTTPVAMAMPMPMAPIPPLPTPTPAPSSLDEALTAAGVVVGTPAYMSPEQLAGEQVDARSDQFSYCVALYEALAGRRPFVADSIVQLAHEIRSVPPRGVGRAPGWLRALVLRGLSIEPADRFPSMTELLAELARGRTRTRRRVTVAGAVAAVALLAGGTAWVTQRLDAPAEDVCATAGVAPEPVLDGAALRRSLAPVREDGALIAERVAARVEAWRGEVASLRATACRRSRDGRESAELFDLRMACVARGARDLAALSAALARPTPELVDNAVPAIARATDLSRCRGDRAQLEGLTIGSAAAEALRERLALAVALHASAKFEEAHTEAQAVAAEAARQRFHDIEAEAWELCGGTREDQGNLVAARAAWQRALVAIEATTDTHTRAQIYLDLARADSFLDRVDDAARWVAQARALVDRTGDRALRWTVTMHEGDVAYADEKIDASIALYRRALVEHAEHVAASSRETSAASATVLGGGLTNPSAIDEARVLAVLGDALASTPDTAEAERTLRRAIALFEGQLGPHHPILAGALVSLIEVTPNDRESIALARRAFAIATATPGPNTKYSEAARALGTALDKIGQSAEAARVLEDALAHHPAPNTASYASLLSWRASARRNGGKLALALDDGLRSVELVRAQRGPDSRALPMYLLDLAETQRSLRRYDDALASVTEAARIVTKWSGPDAPDMYWPALVATMVALDAAKLELALRHAERALALRPPGSFANERATAQVAVARTLHALRRDRDRAVQFAQEALSTFIAVEDHERQRDARRVLTLLGAAPI